MTITWYFDNTALTDFDVDGGHGVEDLSPVYDIPPRRGDNVQVPFRDGRFYVGKLFEQRAVDLGMWVVGHDADDFETRVDALKALLASGRKVLKRENSSDSSVRQAYAEVTGALGFKKQSPRSGKFTVSFLLSDPLFYSDTATEVVEDVDAESVSFAVNNPGTATNKQATITIDGPVANPVITNSTTGVSVTFNGTVAEYERLVIYCADFLAELDGANVLASLEHSGDYAFFTLAPGSNTITVDSDAGAAGQITISFYAAYL